ncbi:MAG TPA: glycosyl hydrolase 108 family protein [Gemmatimonadales bacterium]|nr:glycosyl hydrolase 108 family protein [Gemmatimonadales bacterium]
MTPFDFAIPMILLFEGGYTAGLPGDPGGETKFGISKRSYPTLNIQALTQEEALAIYERDFWTAIKLSLLPAPLALAVFDCAVLQGPKTAVRILQAVLGVPVDGVIGPVTVAAVKPTSVRDFTAERLIRLSQVGNYTVFAPGWVRRVLRAYDYAQGVPL